MSLAVSAALGAGAQPASAPSLGLNGRVVIIGDSITGCSQNLPYGFCHRIDWALKQVHPDGNVTLVPLGGSGMGIGAWVNTEKKSRDEDRDLDVHGFGVKANLDQPADVVVILMGMNDVLAPSLSERQGDQEKWAADYQTLIASLRERVKPRILALATFTPCGEDLNSARNRLRADLNRRIADLAASEKCLLWDVGGQVEKVLAEGRTYAPEFHVTYDFVHPNVAGHAAIAATLLNALGESKAADLVTETYLKPEFIKNAGAGPWLSYRVDPQPAGLEAEKLTFRVSYWWHDAAQEAKAPPTVALKGPDGWQVTPASLKEPAGVFTATGTPERIVNFLTLSATDGNLLKEANVPISAPWLVATGLVKAAWKANPYPKITFDANAARHAFEDDWVKGIGLGQVPDANGAPKLVWQRYFASPNYTGGNKPGSIDLTAMVVAQNFEAAYCARWVYSAKDRPAEIILGSQQFTPNIALVVYMNGSRDYAGIVTGEPKKTATVQTHLKKGWNCLVVYTSHWAWQWQFSLDLVGIDGDDLGDLRYSSLPVQKN